ncbi:hypothetical protein [Streptomyces acidiscabies]|uniref:hypothetical protein n=1 Tax=Streptomyces acidiscabies TaxID=42234 RepID=UPI0015BCADA8|nr:hypothetical protein [Streptomyces acidiscabies]
MRRPPGKCSGGASWVQNVVARADASVPVAVGPRRVLRSAVPQIVEVGERMPGE